MLPDEPTVRNYRRGTEHIFPNQRNLRLCKLDPEGIQYKIESFFFFKKKVE